MCLQNHVQATFEHRRQASLVQDESSVQFKIELLAQSMQSPNDFDIECPNCGCIFRDVILRKMLGLPLPVQAKTEKESAAVIIQTTFRRFRIRWRYCHSNYCRQKIVCLRSYKAWVEQLRRGDDTTVIELYMLGMLKEKIIQKDQQKAVVVNRPRTTTYEMI